MGYRAKVVALAAPLALVEAASLWKLSHWLEWGNETWLAVTTGLAFVGLMVGAIVAMSLDAPPEMRRHVHVAGVWLLVVQAVANTFITFEHGLLALPIDVVTRFVPIDPELARKAMAVVQGSTLSIVSISFWSVLAHLLRSHWEEQKQQRERLSTLETLIEEATN